MRKRQMGKKRNTRMETKNKAMGKGRRGRRWPC